MKAVVCRAYGGPEVASLEEIATPEIRAGHVRIRVEASSASFASLLAMAGKHQNRAPLPLVAGTEISGVVTELGDDATRFRIGDRVIAGVQSGGYAQEVVAPEQTVFSLPDDISFDDGAQFPTIYGTAYGALKWRAQVEPGKSSWFTARAVAVASQRSKSPKRSARKSSPSRVLMRSSQLQESMAPTTPSTTGSMIGEIACFESRTIAVLMSSTTLSVARPSRSRCDASPRRVELFRWVLPAAPSQLSRQTSCWSRTSRCSASTGATTSAGDGNLSSRPTTPSYDGHMKNSFIGQVKESSGHGHTRSFRSANFAELSK